MNRSAQSTSWAVVGSLAPRWRAAWDSWSSNRGGLGSGRRSSAGGEIPDPVMVGSSRGRYELAISYFVYTKAQVEARKKGKSVAVGLDGVALRFSNRDS